MEVTNSERGSIAAVLDVVQREGAMCGASPLGMMWRELALELEALRDGVPMAAGATID